LANELDNQVAPSPINNSFPPEESAIDAKIVEAPPSPLPNDDLGRPDPLVFEKRNRQKPSWIPVKKIKSNPFRRGGEVLNTVYIARPGENLRIISQKIYGDKSKASLLERNNSYLAGGVDPGDKVYYNSPNRPGDVAPPIKAYHEDLGLAPQVYTTVANDDMRRLGAKLLGFQSGWKEIWAINPNVASKSTLPPGIELRYWTGTEQNIIADTFSDVDDEPVVGQSFEDEVDFQGDVLDEVAAIEEEALPEPVVSELDEGLEELEDEENAFTADIGGDSPGQDPNLKGDGSGQGAVAGTVGSSGAAQAANKRVKPKGKNRLLVIGAFGLGLIFLVALVAVAIKNRKEDDGLPPSMEYTQV